MRYCSYCGREVAKQAARCAVGSKSLLVHLKCLDQFESQLKINKLEELKEKALQDKTKTQ